MSFLTKKQIATKIGAIGKQNVKMRTEIQEICTNLVFHAAKHGDVTLADRLLEATDKLTRRQAIINWLSEFGPYVFDSKEHVFKLAKKHATREMDEQTLEIYCLEQRPTWYEFTKEAKLQPYSLEKDVLSTIKRMMAHMEKGEVTGRMGDLAVAIKNTYDDWKESASVAAGVGQEAVASDVTIQRETELKVA